MDCIFQGLFLLDESAVIVSQLDFGFGEVQTISDAPSCFHCRRRSLKKKTRVTKHFAR